jgi:hypothetical protein
MVMYRCCGDGCVANAHPSDMTVCAIALSDWASLARFDQIAKRLCDLQREEYSIEVELQQLLTDLKFTAYRQVFKAFGFGIRLESIILSQIYPVENYFGADGKPEVRIRS